MRGPYILFAISAVIASHTLWGIDGALLALPIVAMAYCLKSPPDQWHS